MVAVPNEPKKAPKAVPVDLAGLRASMEARLKEKEKEAKPPKAPPGKKGKNVPIAPMPGFATISGQYDTIMASSVSSTLSALGAALEPKVGSAEEAEGLEEEKTSSVASAQKTDAHAPAENMDFAPDVVQETAKSESTEEEPEFSGRRTDALPLVTIDIERLLQASFTATQFGKLALTNQALDPHLRQTLIDVESGKTLLLVLNEAARSPASILSTYRFCLARGYIISADPVLPLTADLLLGRMELDQYLLQRRRINGDELRDLIEIERQKGVKLSDLLVRHGYLTAGDLERLLNEQKRFALK
jgi:hypothetical protein